MSAAPPVSVYMPAFNVQRYVRAAFDTVVNQTFGDFEFIIIDDGSTDGTLEILRDLAGRDKRVQLITRPNRGVSATSNEAIGLARGEFVVRMDGDDLTMPDRVQKQVDYLRANPDCVALGAHVLMMDADGMPLFPMPQVTCGHDEIDAALMGGGWPILQAVCTFRQSAVVGVGGYRPHLSLHEDQDLFVRLAEVGRLENLPEVLLHYRRHLKSITFREVATSQHVLSGILREARQRRGLPEPTEPERANSNDGMEMNTLRRCRQWAWMSLKAKNIATARKYAWEGLRHAPLSLHSWKLAYCATRGR